MLNRIRGSVGMEAKGVGRSANWGASRELNWACANVNANLRSELGASCELDGQRLDVKW